LTPEARAAFESAEAAFYLVSDPVTVRLLDELNPFAVSLFDHYEPGLQRRESYDRMKEAILTEVRAERAVCAAFYGHAGVFVAPSHEAIRQARAEGFVARMLPAVSAEDCLFADLGVDPGAAGCQSFDATDFLLRRRTPDPTAVLILWQVSVIGFRVHSAEPAPRHLDVLAAYLEQWYDAEHRVILYAASPYPYPVASPSIRELSLRELADARPTPLATLYVPPSGARADDAEMAIRLGLTPS
jgi:tetrapyrrole (corrin/porphyrin) methylase-like protein